MKRHSQLAHLHRAARYALEPLEGRLLLSASPYVTGVESIHEDGPYTLNLFSNGAAFSYWAVNWGDGVNGNSDVSIVSGATPSIVHHYYSPGNFVITAQAVDNLGNTLSTSTLGIDGSYGSNGQLQITQSLLSALNGPNSTVEAVATEPNGQVVILTSTGLDRFNTNGTTDNTFGSYGYAALPAPSNDPTATNVQFTTLAIDSNGDIAIGGTCSNAFLIGKYNSSGQLNLSGALMSAAGPASVKAVEIENNSVELVGIDLSGKNVYWLENLTTYSQSFSVLGADSGWDYTQAGVDPSGNSWIVAQNGSNSVLDNYSTTGSELSVSTSTIGVDTAMAVDASGDFFIAGQGLSEYSPTGALDTSFGTDGSATTPFQINQLVTLPNGQILAGDAAGDLARFNADGSLDTTFGNGGVFSTELNAAGSNAGENIVQLPSGEYEIAAADGNGNVNIERLFSSNALDVVSGESPVASFLPIGAATVGQSLTIPAATAAYNGSDPIFESWTVTDANGNAFALPSSGITDVPALTITPDNAGIWTVSMTVTDLWLQLTTTLSEQFNVAAPAQTELPGLLPIVPSSNPALPAGINTFTPPISGQAAASNAPVIAASNLTAQPNQNISLTGSQLAGATFTIYGQTNSTDALLTGTPVQDSSSLGDILTINPTEPAGSEYVLWPQSSGGVVGNPIFVNQPQTTWLSDTTPAPGQTISVYGQNLSNGASTAQSWVYLQPPSGAGQWLNVTSANPYQVQFTIPSSGVSGTYQVWVNNGLGGQFSWSSPLTLTVQPSIGWTAPTVNVMNYGATGNGTTDDGPAIEKAIAALAPGGTLYFPTGNYLIGNEQIDIPQNVRVTGDGPTKTILTFTADLNALNTQTGRGAYAIGTPDGWTDHYLGAFNQEFDSLTLSYDGPTTTGELVRQRYGQNVTLNNVVLNAPNLLDVDWLGSAQMSITNSTVIGQGIDALDVQNINIDSTNFLIANQTVAAVSVWNGHNISLTNSTVQNYDDASSNLAGWGQGRLLYNNLFEGSVYNEYVAGNTTINMGYPVGINAGEQILFEGAQDTYFGAPVSATSTTITIPLPATAPSTYVGLNVIVTAGTGLAQMRTVESYTQGVNSITLTLDSPWTVTPNSQSHVEVCTNGYNSVFYENTLQDQTGADGANNLSASIGFEVYNGGYNLVFDGNTTNNLNDGVILASNNVTNPSYFIEVLNNQFNNVLQQGVTLQPQPMASGVVDNDPNFIGVLIRNNTINTATSIAQGISVVRPVPLGDANIHLGTASLVIVEDNTVTSADTAFALDGADDPDVLVYDNTFEAGSFAGGNSVGASFGTPAQYSTTALIMINDTYQGFNQQYSGTIPQSLFS